MTGYDVGQVRRQIQQEQARQTEADRKRRQAAEAAKGYKR